MMEYREIRTKPRVKRKKKNVNAVNVPLAPTIQAYSDILVDTATETPETEHKLSTEVYRQQLKKAKREGNEARLVRLMKMKELEVMTGQEDEFQGAAKITKAALKKHSRLKLNMKETKVTHSLSNNLQSERIKRRMKHTTDVMGSAVKQSIRADSMLTEDTGLLEAEEGEATADITQHDIVKHVDMQSAQKHFTLSLKDFGPYHIDYSQNGRYLALAGKLGHAAVIDWQPKNLKCEFNVQETTHDIKYLHNETMIAAAQRQWVYIYDNEGIELHCLKALDSPLQLQFLPFHFLLACSNAKGYLSWLDVSIGERVSGFQTHKGRLNVMSQNPSNAVVILGHSRGTVTMWSPNTKESLVEIQTNDSAVRSICVDKTGNYMATSGMDRKIKVWDLRKYKTVSEFKVAAGAGSLHFSSTGLLAASMGPTAFVYKDTCIRAPKNAYMSHTASGSIQQVQFCPYEDVLGVGSAGGFESLLIPGSGEANFDTMESNPYQSRKQRRHREVRQLLDKIPHDLITLDPESMQQPKPSDVELEVKNSLPKKWLKYHYIPSKSIMESKRRWELKSQLAKKKIARTKAYEAEKKNPKPYDPMARFRFGG